MVNTILQVSVSFIAGGDTFGSWIHLFKFGLYAQEKICSIIVVTEFSSMLSDASLCQTFCAPPINPWSCASCCLCVRVMQEDISILQAAIRRARCWTAKFHVPTICRTSTLFEYCMSHVCDGLTMLNCDLAIQGLMYINRVLGYQNIHLDMMLKQIYTQFIYK